MPRIALALALATALAMAVSPPARTEPVLHLDPEPRWRHAKDMPALVATLDDWLDAHSDWPQRETPPRILHVSSWQAEARRGASASFQRGPLRGLYDPERAEILLVAPWDPRSAEDVSVLLHELAHHRQAPHHWYCPAAQELPAYRLQEAWLEERGMRADFNWIAVVLDAGCTPRDIHPE